MPDKPLTVLTYAASASLAAVALVYFFNPNYLIDGDSSSSSASTRKKGIVGLFNPANDCFINSILQSLAGIGDLRLYLIRELHRRELGGPDVYAMVPLVDSSGKEVDSRKLVSLQNGEVTRGLKIMIDRLNERPIYRKTISAAKFIQVLEHAFETRISKSQQDAQELLQIVAERLSEEYHAGREARKRARKVQSSDASSADVSKTLSTPSQENNNVNEGKTSDLNDPTTNTPSVIEPANDAEEDVLKEEEEEGFPFEGRTTARTECQYCHFVPKASPTTFVMLNLTVPQKSSTTLNECFDAHFKTEYINDYRCDKCRLDHAVEMFSKNRDSARSKEQRTMVESQITKLRKAIEEDPEKGPEDIELPDSRLAPKRRIARHVEITSFPRVLVIHLSRSMYDARSSSTKNLAKLSFPERFPVGGILNRRNYKLLGMVTHKGTHNNGHYETFRRQHLYAPFSRPHVDSSSGPYHTSCTPAQSKSKAQSPQVSVDSSQCLEHGTPKSSPSAAEVASPSTASNSPSASSASQSLPSTRPSSGLVSEATAPRPSESSTIQSLPPPAIDAIKSRPSVEARERPSDVSVSKPMSLLDVNRLKRKKRPADRWWRISDDKIKECKTSDVLAMQREVYMLFYEMEKDGDSHG